VNKFAKFKSDTKKKFEEELSKFNRYLPKHPKLSSIKSLQLEGCGIGDTGIKFLVEGGLKECFTLEFLNLSKN